MIVLLHRKDRVETDTWYNEYRHYATEDYWHFKTDMAILATDGLITQYELYDGDVIEDSTCIERWPYPSTFHEFFE